MRRYLRFVVPLLVILGLLAWATSAVVGVTSRSWFEKDLRLRAELAVHGAQEALIPQLRARDGRGIRRVLDNITLDQRVMGAVACDLRLGRVAASAEYPAKLGCDQFRATMAADPNAWTTTHERRTLQGGPVYASVMPLRDGEETLGFVAVIHDVSYVERREADTRLFSLSALLILAVLASASTVIVARSDWAMWTRQMRRSLQGGTTSPEFLPLVRDVRALAAELAADRAHGPGPWTPERLRDLLAGELHGERVVVVSNREPYIHERTENGAPRVVHPASGLVTALEPIMRACSGVWVAHGSGSADRDTVDASSCLRVPPKTLPGRAATALTGDDDEAEDGYTLRRVWLTPEEEKGYYYGFANDGLWPLCHITHTRPMFRTEDWAHYKAVNQKFADAVCEQVDGDDPVILVQDYHLALAPAMIRKRLPRATILTFWHIPWPNAEQFSINPWAPEILRGLLGSTILGFHTRAHCNHFFDAVDTMLEARIDREQHAVVLGAHTTAVRPYPISIEWPSRWAQSAPPPAEARRSVLEELGLSPDAILGVGVDRLDYTKGIEERLGAVEHLLDRHPELRGRFTFAQLAAPSRAIMPAYRALAERVEALAARINARFESGSYRPVVLLHAHHEPPAVFRYYRAADVCYVSSLHDGMNLVAKEFIAAREDERGVLVLSKFTGAARELTEALIVNPYDLDEAADALHAAITMSPGEQAARMRAMRNLVAERNVYRWAGRMLVDGARTRRHMRLRHRLATDTPRGGTFA